MAQRYPNTRVGTQTRGCDVGSGFDRTSPVWVERGRPQRDHRRLGAGHRHRCRPDLSGGVPAMAARPPRPGLLPHSAGHRTPRPSPGRGRAAPHPRPRRRPTRQPPREIRRAGRCRGQDASSYARPSPTDAPRRQPARPRVSGPPTKPAPSRSLAHEETGERNDSPPNAPDHPRTVVDGPPSRVRRRSDCDHDGAHQVARGVSARPGPGV